MTPRRLFLPLFLSLTLHLQAAVLPEGSEVTGQPVETADGWLVAPPKGTNGTDPAADSKIRIKGSIAGENTSLILEGKLGREAPGISVAYQDADGKSISIAGNGMPVTMKSLSLKIGATEYPDYAIAFGWASFYVRPNPNMYGAKYAEAHKEEWEKDPGASERPFKLELRPVKDGTEIEVWINDQMLQVHSVPAPPATYEVALSPDAAIKSLRVETPPDPARLLLPVEEYSRAEGSMAHAQLIFNPAAALPPEFKNLATRKAGEARGIKEAKGIAIAGLGILPGLRSDDLQSFFWRRHALHDLTDQRMFAVPQATYSHAWVLCAAEPDPERESSFTLRLTRYGGSRGNAMADTIVKVPPPDAKDTPDARRVGTVQSAAGKSVPLWLVKASLKNGLIQDILYNDQHRDPNLFLGSRYLDIELLEPLAQVEESFAFPPPTGEIDRGWWPINPHYKGADYYKAWPQPKTSSVTVFGIDLIKSPATMIVGASTGFHVFYQADHPELIATVHAEKKGDYAVQWEIADLEGKIVDSGKQALTLAAGAEQKVSVPVKTANGWFATRMRLFDAAQGELIDHRGSFVMLPPDTRKAGFESPFYGWWYGKNQGSDVKLEEVGPLLQRAGIRRAGIPDDTMPEALTKQYGFTESTLGWGPGAKALNQFAIYELNDKKEGVPLDQAIAELEETIRAQLALWPSADRMNVFHESGKAGAPFPTELWGQPARAGAGFDDENSPDALLKREGGEAAVPVRWSDQDKAAWKRSWPLRMRFLTAMAKMVKAKFPQLKLQYGNDGNSLGIVGELFRQKFPRELIDTVSIEDLGQTIAPERFRMGGVHSAWFLRELARKTGYGDVPVTACTEWIGRMTEKLGLRTQAEWKVRDGLLALAYGFDTISIAGINDCGSGYYYSIWANGNLCSRYPDMMPKPAYAAVATLTQVLDQAKYQRFVPTGSLVLHAEEFQRGTDWVYAFWTVRGQRDMTLEFPEAAERPLIDLYGRESSVTGKTIALKATTSVQYLVSKSKINTVAAGNSFFPEDHAPDPSKVENTIPLESLSDLSIALDKGREQPGWKREGEFEIREVNDPEKGACLEIELKPNRKLIWDAEQEYVFLKLPAPIATQAKNAGIWIKGNGSSGEVDIVKTRPWGPWASNQNLQYNWPGKGTLNFDGWNFIEYPYYDWARENEEGLATRNQVVGLLISMPRKAIHGVELLPVENLKIRVKSILLY